MILASILTSIGLAAAKPVASAVVAGVLEAVQKANGAPVVITPPVLKNVLASEGAAIVPVKSPWKSKINWVAGIAAAFAVAKFLGYDVPLDTQGTVTTAITTLAPIAIIIFRSWFNNSATK